MLPLPSTSTSTPYPYAQITHQPGELIRIFDTDTQIVCWQRHADSIITTYLQQTVTRGILNSGFRTILEAGQQFDPVFLPDESDRDIFANDIHELSVLYHDLLGCPAVGLRLEVLRNAMCPRFHVDHTGIRLVCTYLGPGTEWVDDTQIDRSKLGRGANGQPDTKSGLFTNEVSVETASPFDVVLLKGTLWQGNAMQGAIHRSPNVLSTASPRVLLVMDALWN